jgi:hypothetical protein
MWSVVAATAPGDTSHASEDWHHADDHIVVVLDGATARTDIGCHHGVAWYVEQLGSAIVTGAKQTPEPLTEILADAISSTARLHPDCDLMHPGTPSAGVAVLRHIGDSVDWLVLGDVTVVIDATDGLVVVEDPRVRLTAPGARAEADLWSIGSPRKLRALREMKHLELAARNQPDGYWIAAADPAAARHALAGAIPAKTARRAVVMSDGVERLVTVFAAFTWHQLLSAAQTTGPGALIDNVRHLEQQDPLGWNHPRNKRSDDATAVFIDFRHAD